MSYTNIEIEKIKSDVESILKGYVKPEKKEDNFMDLQKKLMYDVYKVCDEKICGWYEEQVGEDDCDLITLNDFKQMFILDYELTDDYKLNFTLRLKTPEEILKY